MEINVDEKSKLAPICSLASSGRLTYLYFKNRDDAEKYKFEILIGNDLKPRPSHTKMDAYKETDNVSYYYECKCQEILSKSHGLLTKSYQTSELFRELIGGDFDTEKYKPKDYKQRSIDYKFLEFSLKAIGVDSDIQYNKLRFDVKQFICHLIAIAEANKKRGDDHTAYLQYVFFVSPGWDNENNKELRSLYSELKREIEMIWKSPKIQNFCEKHSISYPLPEPMFAQIDKECNDTIYKDIYVKRKR